jgi:carboxypeptidase C (cathepsin A)
MRSSSYLTFCSSLLTSSALISALPAHPLDDITPTSKLNEIFKRQDPPVPNLPAEITDYKTITTPRNITIRYKEPGKDAGICETTADVNSYSGYIDLADDVHVFFWFFESRRDPANDDLTLCEFRQPLH